MEKLIEALEKEIAPFPLKDLQRGFSTLMERYREEKQREAILGKEHAFILNPAQRAAYLAYRLPATLAVAGEVLERIEHLFHPTSFVDLGAGPGTLSLAAALRCPELKQVTWIEKDKEWIPIAKNLQSAVGGCWDYCLEDFTLGNFPSADWVGSSYALSELPLEKQRLVVEAAWESATQGVVFIEPGTRYGFNAILNARKQLIDRDAPIAAPCPHQAPCPLAELGDWCHFAKRVERSKIHKLVKGGELGFEDEKYSYLVAAKVPFLPYVARLVHPTEKHGGHIRLSLCTAQGLIRPTYSKKDGDLYKHLRKLEWGDCINRLDM